MTNKQLEQKACDIINIVQRDFQPFKEKKEEIKIILKKILKYNEGDNFEEHY